jgi:hypothetical protein
MSNKESTTEKQELVAGSKSELLGTNETHTLGLQVLSKLSEMEDSHPVNSLLTHAQRLNNVAHSFVEAREQSYLNNDLENLSVNPSDFAIDAVCKLSQEARDCIKLASQLQKDRVEQFTAIVRAVRG